RAVPVGPRGDQTGLWRRVVDDGSVSLAAEVVAAWDAGRKLGAERRHGLWRRVVAAASVMLAAELVGACDAALNLATEYAKVRVQFDRPIATFQAIRHKAVDMVHRLELARVGTHYAAWASDVDDASRGRAAAMAKGFVAEAAVV